MTSLFDYADAYPRAPGHQRTETSIAAAESMKPTAATLRAKVLAMLERSNGLTTDECADRLSLSVLSVRPRFTELTRMGLARDSGDRRMNLSGRKAVVWQAVTPARLKPKGEAN